MSDSIKRLPRTFTSSLGWYRLSLDSDSIGITDLEARMRPGVLSQGGFLGECEKLEDVIAHDAQILDKLGVTYEELAGKLEELIQIAKKTPSHTVRIGHFDVKVTVYPGFQICPWSPDIHHGQCDVGSGARYASIEWFIRNLNTWRKACGPGLAVHLIRDHHFFQGFESPYRVDPYELTCLLEMGPFKR